VSCGVLGLLIAKWLLSVTDATNIDAQKVRQRSHTNSIGDDCGGICLSCPMNRCTLPIFQATKAAATELTQDQADRYPEDSAQIVESRSQGTDSD